MINSITPEIKAFLVRSFNSEHDFDNLCRELTVPPAGFTGDFEVRITRLIQNIERNDPQPCNHLHQALIKLRSQFSTEINALFQEKSSTETANTDQARLRKIFLSYSSENKTEVDYLDTFFQSQGIQLTRDTRQLPYKGDILKFMQSVRQCDYVITLISADYLKSPFCLFEALELLKDYFKKKILPVCLDDVQLLDFNRRAEWIKYWNRQYVQMKSATRDLDPVQSAGLTRQLQNINNIRLQVDAFLDQLAGMRLLSFRELKSTGFRDLLNVIKTDD